MNRTRWLSGLAVVTILGAGAVPIVASAQGTDTQVAGIEAAAQVKTGRPTALAALLGVDPAVLQAAIKTAAEATPRPEDKRDQAARETYLTTFNANLAAALGVTVEALTSAQAQLKAEAEAKKGERSEASKEKASQHFQSLLARLVGAGILTQAQADEALAQYQLGGREQAQVIKRIRSLIQDEKAEQQFTKLLNRLVGAGLLTQAQADEALAQYLLGGEAKGQVIKRLRALLQEEKGERRERPQGEKRPEKKRQDQKKPGLERALKARASNPV